MSKNLECIDLNSDLILGDPNSDLVHGVCVLEPTLTVGISATETLAEPKRNPGPIEGWPDGLSVNIESGVKLGGGLMVPMGGALEDRDGGGGVGSLESLGCAELSLGGLCGGSGDGISAGGGGGGLGLDVKDDVVNIGVACENLMGSGKVVGRENMEVGIMGAKKGEFLPGGEVIAEKNFSAVGTEMRFDGQESNVSVIDERVENVANVAEGPCSDFEGDRIRSCDLGRENPSVGAFVNLNLNVISEDRVPVHGAVACGSCQGEVEPNSSLVTGLVERLPRENQASTVKVADADDSWPSKDQNATTHVFYSGVAQCVANKSNSVGLVVDFNPYLSADGNRTSRAGFSNEGVEFRGTSGVVLDCLATDAACHVDGVGLHGNQNALVREQMTDNEKPKYIKKKNTRPVASKSGFSVSDLVWGKVRSHPWWPGQIFDPSDSSKKAMKYFKEDSFLVAYFGDATFAWNEASRLKPFREYFSQMEKQSNLEAFCHAVDCALDEVSRRLEFGLACSCLPQEVYLKIKSQIITNSGIREKSSMRDGGDEDSSAAFFEPVKLVEYIKSLARVPYDGVDRLEHVMAQAQLLAFYRWKGYSQLTEFKMLCGLLENDAEIAVLGNKKHHDKAAKDATPDFKGDRLVPLGKGKLKSQDSSSLKCKHVSGDSMYPNKKERSLSDLMAGNHSYLLNGEDESGIKAGSGLISPSVKKRKAVDIRSDEMGVKKSKTPLSKFRVGDSLRRVASQLSGSTPIFRHGEEKFRKTALKNESKEKSARVSSGVSYASKKSKKFRKRKKVIPQEWSSPGDMLSQLCLAAKDPMKGYDFLLSLVSFFSDFRNSACLVCPSSQKHRQSMGEKAGSKTRKKSSKSEITEASEIEYVKDSYWTDMIIESFPEQRLSLENQNETVEYLYETQTAKGIPTFESDAYIQLSPNLDSKQQTVGGDLELDAEKPMAYADENPKEEPSPTALVLNFTDLDSVPSETDLNKIFSRYGSLNESETEVLKKSSRAKVVFKRRSDAETAFSSSGKFSIFGPSLVSYRLKYLPSTPHKASPSSGPTKRSRKNVTSPESHAS